MRIHAVQTGTVAVRERQVTGVGGRATRLARTLLDGNWTEPLPILAWVIEHPEGAIVVDTGETARADHPGYFPRWHPYYLRGLLEWVEPEEEIGPQLRRLGIAPGDVRLVVLTHLHTDHAGGLEHFAGRRILVTPDELRRASGLRGRLLGYLPQHWPRWFRPEPLRFERRPLGPFPASRPLTSDGAVVAVPTPGHTPGHCSVAVDMGEKLVFLAGDASYTDAMEVDGVTGHPGLAARTLERIRRLRAMRPTVYLPSHDPQAPERLAGALT